MINIQRICPDGHGEMVREEGYFALSGLDRIAGGLISFTDPATFRINGKGIVVKVWSCKTCGLIRIYADDSADV